MTNEITSGVNCNFCEYLAAGRSYVYTSSRADNVKRMDISQEYSLIYKGVILAGSLGDSTCSNTAGPLCSGDIDSVGTFARFNKISGISIKYDGVGNEEYLFVADKNNNKIKTLNLKSGSFEVVTFAINVDTRTKGFGGIAVDNNYGKVYAAVTAGIYAYTISLGDASKTIYAGRLWIPAGKSLGSTW
jgi:hypothetical protein